MKKINIGCGLDIREGWDNLDNHDRLGANVIADLNKLPLPIKDNVYDVVFCSHVIEDFTNCLDIIDELIRIAKKGGKIIICVPNETYAWNSIHHTKAFNLQSFIHLPTKLNYGKKDRQIKLLSAKYYGLTERTKKDVNLSGRMYYGICVFMGNLLGAEIMTNTFIKHLFPMINIRVEYEKI